MNTDSPQTPTPSPIEPLTLSLLGRFFGVPLLIIAFIVAGAITVVLLFGAPASPAPRALEALLQAVEGDAGFKGVGGMLLPPDKEYWQANLELAERIEKQEFSAEELKSIAERVGAVVHAELAKLSAQGDSDVAAARPDNATRLEFLVRALGKTKRPEAVGPLVEVIGSGHDKLINAAVQHLGDMHEVAEARAAAPALLPLLQPSNRVETRLMATTALSVLADPANPVVLDALRGLRLADEPEVGWNAALALARLGDPAGKSILLDLLDREFWEKGERYQVVDERNQVRRFAMPPQRVDQLLMAAMDAAAHLDDPELWALIERLSSDTSLNVKTKAAELITGRGRTAQASVPG